MHTSSKKIVIAGCFGFGSEGDEAILAFLCEALRSPSPPFYLLAISRNSTETAAAYAVQACDWSDAVTISEAVRSSEAVIIVGGGLFDTSTAVGLPPAQPAYLMPALLSAVHHKPLLLWGLELDGLGPESMLPAFRAVCVAAARIAVRDQNTRNLLLSLGIAPSNITVIESVETVAQSMPARARANTTLLLDTLAREANWEPAQCAELIGVGLGLEHSLPNVQSRPPSPTKLTADSAELLLKNRELEATLEGLHKQLQEAERLRYAMVAALDIYQAQLNTELRSLRTQRAWKVMLYLRKAYTVLVRGIQLGRVPSFGALLSLIFAPSKNLDCYDLRLPILKHAMPVGLHDGFETTAERFTAPVDLRVRASTTQGRRPDVPRQQKYDVLILPLFEFDSHHQRAQHLASQFARAGHRVFWVSPSRTARAGQRYDAIAVQPRLWEIRLCARLPDVYLGEFEPNLVRDSLACFDSLYRDFSISECCTLVLLPFWRRLGLGLREAFDTKLLYDCTDDLQALPALGAFNQNEEPRLVAEADVLIVPAFASSVDFSEQGDALRPRRIEFAANQSWREHVTEMDQAIRNAFPLVSILIVTHNSAEFVPVCLEGLHRNTSYPSYEVILVDNASRDQTAKLLLEFAARDPRLRVIRNDENLGFAAANNLAAGLASGEYLVLLNIDTIPSPGWIARLVRHCVKHGDIGLIVPVTNMIGNEAKIRVPYTNLAGMEQFAIDLAADKLGESIDLSVGPLFCALLSRALWRRVGPLDERFKTGMFEDDDFSVRIRRAGFRVVAAEDCFVHHFGQGSFAKLAPAYYQEVFATNRRLFEEKWQIEWEPHKYRPGISAEEGRFRPSDFADGTQKD